MPSLRRAGQEQRPYIVLNYDYWHNHFNGDPAAVGRTVQINKHPYMSDGADSYDGLE